MSLKTPLSLCCDVTSKEIFAIFANSVHSPDIRLTQNHFKNALKLLSHTKILAYFCTVFCPLTRNDGLWEEVRQETTSGSIRRNKDWVKLPTPFYYRACKKYPSCLGSKEVRRLCRGRLYFLADLYFAIMGSSGSRSWWSVEGPG